MSCPTPEEMNKLPMSREQFIEWSKALGTDDMVSKYEMSWYVIHAADHVPQMAKELEAYRQRFDGIRAKLDGLTDSLK